jgi:hypothetical protein
VKLASRWGCAGGDEIRFGRLGCSVGDVKPDESNVVDGTGLAPNRDGRDTNGIVDIRGDEGSECA